MNSQTTLVKVKPVTVDGVKFYVSPDGSETGVSVNGLARLAGVDPKAIQQLLGLSKEVRMYGVAKWLEPLTDELFSPGCIGTDQAKIVTSKVAAEVIAYYAYDSKVANATARYSAKQFMALGMDGWIKTLTGYSSNESQNTEMKDAFKSAMSEALSEMAAEMKAEVQKIQASSDKYNNIKATTGSTFKGLDRMLDSISDQPALPPADDNYTVAGYLKQKKVAMSRQELAKFSMDVAGTYRTITGKEPKKIKSFNSVNVYSTAELPILDMALAKHLGL